MDKKVILVVDDEEDLTWSISRSLRKYGPTLEAHCVNSGEAALRFCESHTIDLLVTDLRMPGMDGIELFRTILNCWPQTRVIMMTAFRSDIINIDDGGSKPDFFIEKPFDLDCMRKLIFESLALSDHHIGELYAHSRIRETLANSCSRHSSTLLTLENGPANGRIYLREGEIVHAECGELEGENALFDMLAWDQGRLRVQDNPLTNRKRTIRRNWRSLLNTLMID